MTTSYSKNTELRPKLQSVTTPASKQLLAFHPHYPTLNPKPAYSWLGVSYRDMAREIHSEGSKLSHFNDLIVTLSTCALEQLFPNEKSPAERYCAGLRDVLGKIKQTQQLFENKLLEEISTDSLYQLPRTLEAMKRAEAAQVMIEKEGNRENPFLILPVHIGRKGCGSINHVREGSHKYEFGLGALAVACYVLTHPNWWIDKEALDLQVSGDVHKTKSKSGTKIEQGLVFYSRDNGCGLCTEDVHATSDHNCPVSAYFPPPPK